MAGTNGNRSRPEISGGPRSEDAVQTHDADRERNAQSGLPSSPRLDRVSRLRDAIASGCYFVPSSAVAERIVDHLLVENAKV